MVEKKWNITFSPIILFVIKLVALLFMYIFLGTQIKILCFLCIVMVIAELAYQKCCNYLVMNPSLLIWLSRLSFLIILVAWNFSFYSLYQRDFALSWSMKKAESGYFLDSAAYSLGGWEKTSGQVLAFCDEFLAGNTLLLTKDSTKTTQISRFINGKDKDNNYKYIYASEIYEQTTPTIDEQMLQQITQSFEYVLFHDENKNGYLFILNHLKRENTQILALTASEEFNLVVLLPMEDYYTFERMVKVDYLQGENSEK